MTSEDVTLLHLIFFIRAKDQDIEWLKRGRCYEREKQRAKGKQEGAAEKPQREEKDEEGEEGQVGLEEASGVTSLSEFTLSIRSRINIDIKLDNAL